MSALLAVSWEWELRGTLIVIIAVSVLCGSLYMILGTNMGARLGFLVAFAALAGICFISRRWIAPHMPPDVLTSEGMWGGQSTSS